MCLSEPGKTAGRQVRLVAGDDSGYSPEMSALHFLLFIGYHYVQWDQNLPECFYRQFHLFLVSFSDSHMLLSPKLERWKDYPFDCSSCSRV